MTKLASHHRSHHKKALLSNCSGCLEERFHLDHKHCKMLNRAASILEKAVNSTPLRTESEVRTLNTMCGLLRSQIALGHNCERIKGIAPGLGCFHMSIRGSQERLHLLFAIAFDVSPVSPVQFEKLEFVLECSREGILETSPMWFDLALDIMDQASSDRGSLYFKSWHAGASLQDPMGEKPLLRRHR